MTNSYDALLLVSFGGPEGPDDVMPFLENVLRGRNVPRERMLEVAEHYQHFGGISPINAQNRALIEALQAEFAQAGLNLPIYWGNRNWHPLLPATLGQMRDAGVRRAIAFFTSSFSSYSGCRQYRENVAAAHEAVGPGAPQVDKLRVFYNHPGFIEATVDRVRDALDKISAERRTATGLVTAAIGHSQYDLVYQSRSGPPTQPWLEPDVNDHLRKLATDGIRDVVVIPIGFISDHMEVLYDLDDEAAATSREIGLNMIRAATVGTHPRFVRMIRELVEERLREDADRPALGTLGPSHDVCPIDCCLPPPRPPQRPAPATPA